MANDATIHESDSTQQELLPCPMCGGKPEVIRIGTRRRSHIIECEDCGLSLETGETEGFHGLSWNTRAPIKPKSGGVNLFLTEVSHDRLMLLEHLARTTDMWLDAEDAYLKHQGEDIPYTEEYASIVESRIFNNHTLRSAIKNYRIQSQSKESSNDS